MNNYLRTKANESCCGCRACEQICPKHCISIYQDREGFLFPKIEEKLCIDCNLCAKVCPFDTIDKGVLPTTIYGTQSKYKESLKKSSSGGVFYLLAMSVINDGGSVFGAALDLGNRYLSHTAVNREQDISKILGSKYICSDTENTFKEVRELLFSEKKVLYVGTPCQIAGLKSFLRKDYSNLVTCDLLCHGVPSQYVFDSYINYLERKHNGKVSNISFRDKEKNGWSITLRYDIERNGKNKIYYEPAGLSPYFFGFLRGMFLREACYTCPYTKLERVGDITLADFWGVKDILPQYDVSDGCSCVLINSEKGQKMFNNIIDNLKFCEKVTYEQAYKQNINFKEPCLRPQNRDFAITDIRNKSFEYVSKTYCNNPRANKIRIKRFINSIKSIMSFK